MKELALACGMALVAAVSGMILWELLRPGSLSVRVLYWVVLAPIVLAVVGGVVWSWLMFLGLDFDQKI